MKRRVCWGHCLLFPLVALAVDSIWASADVESSTFRFEFDNDIFLGSDNLFTDGWSMQWHSPVGQSWEDVGDSHFNLTGLGQYLPLHHVEGRRKRHTLAVGQYMQTPADLESDVFDPNDVPYAGALVFVSSWYEYDNTRFTGIEINLGVIGEESLAESSQKTVHEAIGSVEPQGWHHQLESRAVVNLGYMEKMKLKSWSSGTRGADISISGVLVGGTMYTAAESRLEWRFGNNMPTGFVYTPDEVGATMYYDAVMDRPNPARHSLYMSTTLGVRFVGFNYFLEGETESGELLIEEEPWVGELQLGIHWLLQSFGFHATVVLTTDVVKSDTSDDPQLNDNYGDLVVEYRW